jgi:dTDP-4-amino-4,6-dideoxy-D-galactose acyltransferase
MQPDGLCQYLDWDSSFWGRRIARATLRRLEPETLASLLSSCDAQSIDCLYFLADADDAATVRLAEANQFRFVDIRLTLERRLDEMLAVQPGLDSRQPVRLAAPEDVPALRSIARASYLDSRFYFDAGFPASQCDLLYETWIEKSCQGYADAVLVAEHLGQAAGYVSCHLSDEATGEIGLVGVGAGAQGLGLGQHLVEAALDWFARRGMRRVTVVTQGRNCKAQRLYQKCGFKTQSVRLWYHRWFTGPES